MNIPQTHNCSEQALIYKAAELHTTLISTLAVQSTHIHVLVEFLKDLML